MYEYIVQYCIQSRERLVGRRRGVLSVLLLIYILWTVHSVLYINILFVKKSLLSILILSIIFIFSLKFVIGFFENFFLKIQYTKM